MTSAKQQDVLARARNAYRIGDYDNADKLAQEVLKRSRRSYAGHVLLGMVYARTDRPQLAIEEFQKARNLKPESVEPYNNLGVMYRLAGRLTEAREALNRAAELAPERADILYNLGNICKMAGNEAQAIAAYRRAIALDRSCVVAYNNLGTIYERQGEHAHAAAVFEDGLGYDQNHPTLRYNLGIACRNLGRLDDAKEQFERALKARPGWLEALNNLGLVMQALKRYEQSLARFREILDLDHHNPIAENNIATVYAQQGNTDKALEHYARALEHNPDYARAAENLGQILERKPVDSSFVERLRKAADKAAENSELQLLVGKLLSERGLFDDANRYLRSVVAREPDNPRARRYSGLLAYRKGDSEAAGREFDRLLQLDPDAEDYRLDLGRIHTERAEYDEALQQVREFRERRPEDLNGVLRESEVLRCIGRAGEAAAILPPFKLEHPESTPLLTEMAQVYRDAGDTGAALQSLNELVSLQGKRGRPDDINGLNESLALYEQTAAGTERADSLNRLSELALEAELGRSEAAEHLQLESTGEQDEDSIPVLGLEETSAARAEHAERHAANGEAPPTDYSEPTEQAQAPAFDNYPRSFMEMIEPQANGIEIEPESSQPSPPAELSSADFDSDSDLGAGRKAAPGAGSAARPAAGTPENGDTALRYGRSPVGEAGDTAVWGSGRAPTRPHVPEIEEPATSAETETPAQAGAGLPATRQRDTPEPREQQKQPCREGVRLPRERQAEMFDYLLDLTQALPEEKRLDFRRSEARMRAEALRNRLRSRPGLRHTAAARRRGAQRETDDSGTAGAPAGSRLKGTLDYLRNLSGALSDPDLAAAIDARLERIAARLRQGN